MATVVVQRPKLKWHEKWFISTLAKGLLITLGHAIAILRGKKKVTMQYPEEKWDANLPDHYRGAPALVTDEHGRERCVSCQLCEFICPPRASPSSRRRSPPRILGPRSKSARASSTST